MSTGSPPTPGPGDPASRHPSVSWPSRSRAGAGEREAPAVPFGVHLVSLHVARVHEDAQRAERGQQDHRPPEVPVKLHGQTGAGAPPGDRGPGTFPQRHRNTGRGEMGLGRFSGLSQDLGRIAAHWGGSIGTHRNSLQRREQQNRNHSVCGGDMSRCSPRSLAQCAFRRKPCLLIGMRAGWGAWWRKTR